MEQANPNVIQFKNGQESTIFLLTTLSTKKAIPFQMDVFLAL